MYEDSLLGKFRVLTCVTVKYKVLQCVVMCCNVLERIRPHELVLNENSLLEKMISGCQKMWVDLLQCEAVYCSVHCIHEKWRAGVCNEGWPERRVYN